MIDFRELAEQLEGELSDAAGVRGAYATDASVYQVMPQAVVWPRHDADLEAIVRFSREHNIPLIGRGGGTSLSGQAIGAGIIVDFSRHMNRVLRIDPERRLAEVEPGVVLDDLNMELAKHRLLFPPDPATANRATIGGMIGNNACGTRSIRYGRTSDSIESLRCILPSGQWLTTRWLTAADWQGDTVDNDSDELALRRRFRSIVDEHAAEIRQRIPALPRIAAGYQLRPFVDGSRDRSWSNLIVGSEGTLAIAARATLRLVPLPTATVVVVSSFPSLDAALGSLPEVLEHFPSAVELLDDVLIHEAIRNAATRELSRDFLDERAIPQGMFLVEFMGDSTAEASERGRRYAAALAKHPGTSHHVLESPRAQHHAWEVRRLGLGLISNIPGKAKGIALIEDACLPIERLPEYNRFVYDLGRRLDMGISTYAHASVGVLHYKVMLDLHDAEERRKMRYIAEQCFEKCRELGGVFSGEHGDGIVRGEFLQRQFGSEVYRCFVAIKELFDPTNLFNPHRKIEAPPLDRLLRYGDGEANRIRYNEAVAKSVGRFRYGEQENLAGAIEQCNGVGACRKNLKGTMCPSYRATRDERDSTRGRANLLRLAISGQLEPPGLGNPELHDALKLCLACKACKSECPNAVDMARLKSEALQARYDQEGIPRAARFIAETPHRLALASRLSWFANGLTASRWLRGILARRYGFDPRRPFPRLASRSFMAWWKSEQARRRQDSTPVGRVALFVDAWNRYLDPQIGIAVVELLWSCGFEVELVGNCDALRTRLSVGLLDEARSRGERLFAELQRSVERGLPILFIEPSEASAVIDDLPDLVGDASLAARVKAAAFLLDDWLAAELSRGKIRLSPKDPNSRRSIVIHPHCHQRALFQMDATRRILTSAGYLADVADWGCCGMAGAFGYTHYDVSRKIADLKFLPGIRAAHSDGKLVVATGRSCREQAADFGGVSLPHWAELLVGQPG